MTIISKMKELKDKYPERTALIDEKIGNKITFREFDNKSDRICSYLKGKKFRKGDKVVVFVPIGIEFYLHNSCTSLKIFPFPVQNTESYF